MSHRRDPAPTWSPARLNVALCAGGWAALLWWLMATERTSLYLSSRTGWVVPMGAVLLTLAGVGRLVTARARRAEPITRSAALATAVILLPVVVVVALPPSSLGSFAAARRSSLSGVGAPVAGSEDISSGGITLFEVAGAGRSRAAMRALVARAGTEVSFVGFVDRVEGMPADEFRLTRFVVTCCAADALSVQVRVVGAPPGGFRQDDWVRVTGDIYPLGSEVLVDATDVQGVERPARPYLST